MREREWKRSRDIEKKSGSESETARDRVRRWERKGERASGQKYNVSAICSVLRVYCVENLFSNGNELNVVANINVGLWNMKCDQRQSSNKIHWKGHQYVRAILKYCSKKETIFKQFGSILYFRIVRKWLTSHLINVGIRRVEINGSFENVWTTCCCEKVLCHTLTMGRRVMVNWA